MAKYFLYYVFLIGSGILLKMIGALERKSGRIFFLMLVGATLTVISGARGFVVSYDGTTYAMVFRYFKVMPWIAPQKYDYYMEYGFYFLCKVIAVCGGTARTMFWITSAFVVFSVCCFLYQNTEQVLPATIVLLSFPYLYTSFDLIRYYLAISVILLGYEFVKKRKFVPYCCMIIIACLFHKTAILFLLLYFLQKVKWRGITFFLTLIGTVTVSIFAHSIAVFFSKLFQDYTSYVSGMNAHWIGSFAGGIKTAGMYLIIVCIAGFAYRNLREKTCEQNRHLGFVILTAACSVIFITSSITIRLLVTLLPFMSIGLTELLWNNKNRASRNQVFLQYCTILLCLAYHAFLVLNNWQHIVPYVFGQ